MSLYRTGGNCLPLTPGREALAQDEDEGVDCRIAACD